jgi:hypothetical protein
VLHQSFDGAGREAERLARRIFFIHESFFRM